MKAVVLDGVPNLSGLVNLLVYEKKTVHFFLMCCNANKWVHKTRQVYDPKTYMVSDTHFSRLNVDYSYNHNMNLVDLSDQLRNMYRVDR